jgi:SAM-dependent methyltransferase
MIAKPLKRLLPTLPINTHILDFGSYGFALANYCSQYGYNFTIDALDVVVPETIPANIHQFLKVDAAVVTLPIADQTYDVIVASHVLEHIRHPIDTVGELLRILKTGGTLYIETPSELSLLTKSGRHFRHQGFLSFWDDPTHIRPWTLAAFYRLALGYECEMVEGDYIGTLWDKIAYPLIYLQCLISKDYHRLTDAAWRAKNFSCYALIKRPRALSIIPSFHYISFKKTPD